MVLGKHSHSKRKKQKCRKESDQGKIETQQDKHKISPFHTHHLRQIICHNFVNDSFVVKSGISKHWALQFAPDSHCRSILSQLAVLMPQPECWAALKFLPLV